MPRPPDISTKELAEIIGRAGRALLQPLKNDSLLALHLSPLLARLVETYETNPTEESAEARHEWLTWLKMRNAIEKKKAFGANSYKGVHSELVERLAGFYHDDFLGEDSFRFWFELEAAGKKGARIKLHRRLVKSATSPTRNVSIRSALPTFQRREKEFAAISQALSTPAKWQAVSLFGVPGGGKTELAIEAAHRLELHGDVFFVPVSGLDLPETLRRVLTRLGVAEALQADDRSLHHLYLERGASTNALFVLDDLSEECPVEMLRPPVGISLLMTSRHKLDAGWIAAVKVGELGVPEARDFLCRNIPIQPDHAVNSSLHDFARLHPQLTPDARGSYHVADVIAVLCGLLPCAISLAAACIRAHGGPEAAEQYAEQLRRAPCRVRALGWSAGINSVEARFRSAYLSLTGDGQELFRKLSVFHEPFDLSEAQIVYGKDPRPQLGELEAMGLIAWEAGTRRYRQNELLRDFGALVLRENGDEPEAFARITRYLADASDRLVEYYATAFVGPDWDPIAQVRFSDLADRQRDLSNTITSAARWLATHTSSGEQAKLPSVVISLSKWAEVPNRTALDAYELQDVFDAAVAVARHAGDRLRLRVLLLAVAVLREHPEKVLYAMEGLRLTEEDAPDSYPYELLRVRRHGWMPTALVDRVRLLEDELRLNDFDMHRIQCARRLARVCTYAGQFERSEEVLLEAKLLLKSADRNVIPACYELVLATDRARNALHRGDPDQAATILNDAHPLMMGCWGDILEFQDGEASLSSNGLTNFDYVEPFAILAEARATFDPKAGRAALADALRVRKAQSPGERSARGSLDLGRAAYSIGRTRLAERFLSKAWNADGLSYEENAEVHLWLALIWKDQSQLGSSRDFLWKVRKAFRETGCYLTPVAESNYVLVATAMGWRLD